MKERRLNPDWDRVVRTWTKIWLALLVFATVLWVTDAPAQSYDRDFHSEPYSGWHADMEAHEQRQTELMERQERRAQRRERQERSDQNWRNTQAYQERLRRGGY